MLKYKMNDHWKNRREVSAEENMLDIWSGRDREHTKSRKEFMAMNRENEKYWWSKLLQAMQENVVFHDQIYENSGKAKHTPEIATQMAFNSEMKSSFNIMTTQNVLYNL